MFLPSGKTTDKLIKEAHELSKFPIDRELDVLLSSGEQISISKLSILLNELGYEAISLTGWQAGIYTNNVNQDAIIENINTSRILRELKKRKIVIIAGFQGINENMDITTLGRGGSDTTAVAVASALNATECLIFSDVDGVYTTDPKKISVAKKLERLSYTEMLDISNEGAKVLHNRCVEIGNKFNIPIITKSTFNSDSGSVINNKIEENIIKSIVKNDNLFLVTLNYDSYSLELFLKLQEAFIKYGISPIQLFNSSSLFNVQFIIMDSDRNKLQELLNKDFNFLNTSFKKISRISIIGYGITNDFVIKEKIWKIIKDFKTNIFSTDITRTKMTITFSELYEDNLLEIFHKTFFEK